MANTADPTEIDVLLLNLLRAEPTISEMFSTGGLLRDLSGFSKPAPFGELMVTVTPRSLDSGVGIYELSVELSYYTPNRDDGQKLFTRLQEKFDVPRTRRWPPTSTNFEVSSLRWMSPIYVGRAVDQSTNAPIEHWNIEGVGVAKYVGG